MPYPAISLTTATVSRHRRPPKRLQIAAKPPIYPNSSPDHRFCNFLTPLPVSSRLPSVSIGGFGISIGIFAGLDWLSVHVIDLQGSAPYILPPVIGGFLGSAYLVMTGCLRLFTTVGESELKPR